MEEADHLNAHTNSNNSSSSSSSSSSGGSSFAPSFFSRQLKAKRKPKKKQTTPIYHPEVIESFNNVMTFFIFRFILIFIFIEFCILNLFRNLILHLIK
jgi:hypothetical protein